jgi:hypothetical protein
MFEPETAETTDFKRCQACGAAQKERDKFCRHCGVSQSRRLEQLNCMTGRIADNLDGGAGRSGCETSSLTGRGILRRSYSGKLVGIVTQELSEHTSSFRANRWAMLLISLLVAAPLWLMIVLLSPLDAYVAAKDLAKQVCPR